MNVYSYIVSHDTGFAPNPFWGYCTIACCKPAIRRTASVGDWIVGLAPKALGNHIVFALKVMDKLTFVEYWRDGRFKDKRPHMKSRDARRHAGDNIYKPSSGEKFVQLPSRHANPDGSENQLRKMHDLNGQFVLISDQFSYFGKTPKKLPKKFTDIIVQRGHKKFQCGDTNFEKGRGGFPSALARYLESLPSGRQNDPRSWPEQGGTLHRGCRPCRRTGKQKRSTIIRKTSV